MSLTLSETLHVYVELLTDGGLRIICKLQKRTGLKLGSPGQRTYLQP